jgi:hypothetical protein
VGLERAGISKDSVLTSAWCLFALIWSHATTIQSFLSVGDNQVVLQSAMPWLASAVPAENVERPHNLTALPFIRLYSNMGQVQAMQCSLLQYLLLHALDAKFSKELLC